MGTLTLKADGAKVARKKLKQLKKASGVKKSAAQIKAEERVLKAQVRKERREKVEATRALLVETFPLLFMPKKSPKLPLAIGISSALFAALPDVPRIKIRRAVADYTSGPTYLRAIIEGEHRFGVDGSIAGTIEPDHKVRAAEKLEALNARWAKRKSLRK